jgi:aminoglycoside 3-N-acetyltransferase
MSLRNLLRSLTPNVILSRYRSRKKSEIRKKLAEAKSSGKIITKADLIHAFQASGIEKGDVLLVHSSLSAIGYVENGPKDVVEALLEAIGAEGHLLMPNSPNASFQLDYIRQLDLFDVENSPSALGAISEWFRKLPNAERSTHPTEPVSCIGPDASWFVSDHFGQLTPYNSNSPFSKVIQRKGKILYLGVSLSNAGTNLHTLEDAVDDFPYPVYAPEKFEVNVKFANGSTGTMETFVHNPEQSKKRKCDDLLPLFLQEGAGRKVDIFHAKSLLFDAEAMSNVMLNAYRDKGVTMYTPNGR